jgi:hypothetical protein
MTVLLVALTCLVLVLASVISTAWHAATRKKKAMVINFLLSIGAVVNMCIHYGLAMAILGGFVLAIALVWLHVIVKNGNNNGRAN